jgi:uncharacterized membrane protein (UPF0127 family)
MSHAIQGPRTVRIRTARDSSVLAERCLVADGFLSRLRGLLGRDSLSPGEGLWLRPCNDIHMWFMRFPIDVVFVRSELPEGSLPASEIRLKVTSVHPDVRPWRVLPLRDGKARETLELPAGTVNRLGLQPGDELLCSS